MLKKEKMKRAGEESGELSSVSPPKIIKGAKGKKINFSQWRRSKPRANCLIKEFHAFN